MSETEYNVSLSWEPPDFAAKYLTPVSYFVQIYHNKTHLSSAFHTDKVPISLGVGLWTMTFHRHCSLSVDTDGYQSFEAHRGPLYQGSNSQTSGPHDSQESSIVHVLISWFVCPLLQVLPHVPCNSECGEGHLHTILSSKSLTSLLLAWRLSHDTVSSSAQWIS